MVRPDDRRRVKLRTMYCARRGRKVGVAQGEYSRLLFFQKLLPVPQKHVQYWRPYLAVSFLLSSRQVERPCAKQLQQNAL